MMEHGEVMLFELIDELIRRTHVMALVWDRASPKLDRLRYVANLSTVDQPNATLVLIQHCDGCVSLSIRRSEGIHQPTVLCAKWKNDATKPEHRLHLLLASCEEREASQQAARKRNSLTALAEWFELSLPGDSE